MKKLKIKIQILLEVIKTFKNVDKLKSLKNFLVRDQHYKLAGLVRELEKIYLEELEI